MNKESLNRDKRTISCSQSVFYNKRLLPLCFAALVILVAFLVLAAPDKSSSEKLADLLGIAAVSLAFAYIIRRQLTGIADRVIDHGDALTVVFGEEQETLAYRDIISATYLRFARPPRVILNLGRDSRFGSVLYFLPKRRWYALPFTSCPMVEELNERLKEAKRKSPGLRDRHLNK